MDVQWLVVEDSEDELAILPSVSSGIQELGQEPTSLHDPRLTKALTIQTAASPPSSSRTACCVRRSPDISIGSLFTPPRVLPRSEIANFTSHPSPPHAQHSSPFPSPAAHVRKRKRTPPFVIDLDEDNVSELPGKRTLSTEGPALFFASSSSLSSLDSGIVARARKKDAEESSGRADKKVAKVTTKSKATKRKGKGKKKLDDERQTETSQDHAQAGPAPQEPAVSSKPTKSRKTKANAKRKGKGRIIESDAEKDTTPLPAASIPQSPRTADVLAHSDASPMPMSKENRPPDKLERPNYVPSNVACAAPLASRAASIKPKATPMSELIRRVNSQPSSPFPSASRTYSSLLKSSRTMLSRIAPLHPNRRSPPPPPPRPPPPKKSKKQIALEERIEEELAETVEGWSCMAEEERKGLLRARIDVELGYE